MIDESKYHLVHYSEAVYSDGKFEGVRVFVAIGRELTEEEKWIVRRNSDEMMKKLRRHINLNDPKLIGEHEIERSELISCFPRGIPLYVEEIPNGYCNEACCVHKPWLVVTTSRGRITIGWRKRVISIEWTGSEVKHKADDLFPTEDTTKGEMLIHAWGLEKAREYLEKIISSEVAETTGRR